MNQHESKEKVQILRCEMMEDGKMGRWFHGVSPQKGYCWIVFFFGFDVLTAIRSKVLDLEEIM